MSTVILKYLFEIDLLAAVFLFVMMPVGGENACICVSIEGNPLTQGDAISIIIIIIIICEKFKIHTLSSIIK
jgi:hypothetical protein